MYFWGKQYKFSKTKTIPVDSITRIQNYNQIWKKNSHIHEKNQVSALKIFKFGEISICRRPLKQNVKVSLIISRYH